MQRTNTKNKTQMTKLVRVYRQNAIFKENRKDVSIILLH